MDLTVAESDLIEALRRLPDGTAQQIAALVSRLAEAPEGSSVDWSDSWSDEDLSEFSAASAQRLASEDEHV